MSNSSEVWCKHSKVGMYFFVVHPMTYHRWFLNLPTHSCSCIHYSSLPWMWAPMINIPDQFKHVSFGIFLQNKSIFWFGRTDLVSKTIFYTLWLMNLCQRGRRLIILVHLWIRHVFIMLLAILRKLHMRWNTSSISCTLITPILSKHCSNPLTIHQHHNDRLCIIIVCNMESLQIGWCAKQAWQGRQVLPRVTNM